MKTEASNDITRIMLFVIVIGALLAGSFWTLLPFLGMLIWAVTIVIATWPLLLRVQKLLWGRRGLAVGVMTFIVSLAFIVPFLLAIGAVISAADRGPAVVEDFMTRGLGAPPQWLASIPLLGQKMSVKWQELSSGGPEALAAAIEPYARSAATWAIAAVGGFGMMLVNILLAVVLIAILYAQGETAARGTLAFATRLGGEIGERTIQLAGKAVRSVALGVVVTAVVQSLLAGLGLWVCGVPHPGLCTALMLILGIAQLGPTLIMVPAIIWMYWTGNTGWGTALLIWSIPVLPIDNVLRPILIRRGVELPMLLIIAGVIGGLISFGVVGLFVGPVVLAATYTLAKDWVARGSAKLAAPSQAA